MAVFHVSVGKILKGTTAGGSAGFARYIAREAQDNATQMARYMERESHHAKDDFVTKDHANLPPWAHDDPARFWAAGDRYETTGWLIARTYEIALPRELVPAQREALVRDLCQTFFASHVHAWAIHNPQARDGQDQPHVHLMVNERVLDGIARDPQGFFRKAAEQGRDPAAGGARKDLTWNHRDRLVELRAGIALLTNAALERAGHTVVVDPRPLRDRGYRYNREPEREQTQRERYLMHQGTPTARWAHTLTDRARLHQHFYPYEQRKAQQFWALQKEREGLQGIDRATMVAHVRERFWGRVPPQHGLQRTAMEVWWANERAIRTQDRTHRAHAWVFQRDMPGDRDQPMRRSRRTREPGRSGRDDGMQQGVSVVLQREYEREKGL